MTDRLITGISRGLGGDSLDSSMPQYDRSPAAAARAVGSPSTPEPPGDPAAIAAAAIASAEQESPPLRVVLGSDSFAAIKQALSGRLAAHREQRQTTPTTDLTRGDGGAAGHTSAV